MMSAKGDLFGATEPPTKPSRRSGPRRAEALAPTSESPFVSKLTEGLTRRNMDELINDLSDEDLGYLALVGTRALKRRLARSQPRGMRVNGARGQGSAVERALQDIAGELRTYENSDDAW